MSGVALHGVVIYRHVNPRAQHVSARWRHIHINRRSEGNPLKAGTPTLPCHTEADNSWNGGLVVNDNVFHTADFFLCDGFLNVVTVTVVWSCTPPLMDVYNSVLMVHPGFGEGVTSHPFRTQEKNG